MSCINSDKGTAKAPESIQLKACLDAQYKGIFWQSRINRSAILLILVKYEGACTRYSHSKNCPNILPFWKE